MLASSVAFFSLCADLCAPSHKRTARRPPCAVTVTQTHSAVAQTQAQTSVRRQTHATMRPRKLWLLFSLLVLVSVTSTGSSRSPAKTDRIDTRIPNVLQTQLHQKSDVDPLRDAHGWITDHILTFFFEHLKERYKNFRAHPQLFIGAAAAFWMRQAPDITDVREALTALIGSLDVNLGADLSTNTKEQTGGGETEKTLRLPRRMFFPLNDNENVEAPGGGTHWSLLVFESRGAPSKRVWRHFDSVRGKNERVARRFAERVDSVLEKELILEQGPNDGADSATAMRVPYEEVLVLQQSNAADCGLHVMRNAERVAAGGGLSVSLSGSGDESPSAPEFSRIMRRTVLDLVEQYRIKETEEVAGGRRHSEL